MNNTQQAGETARQLFELMPMSVPPEYGVHTCLIGKYNRPVVVSFLPGVGWDFPDDMKTPNGYLRPVTQTPTPAPDAVEARQMEWNDVDSPPEPLEVIVLIEGNEYNAYYTDDKWWVDYGGMTVGHKMIDEADIEGWRLPAAALTSSSAPAEQVDVTLLAKMASLAYSKDPEKTKAFEYGFALGMSHAEGQKATVEAEGEKGAVGFAEWIRENYRKGYGPNEEADNEIKLWYHKKEGMGSFKEVTFYTTTELHNLYLTC